MKIIPCRKCGQIVKKDHVYRFEDMDCDNCGYRTMKKEAGRILTDCDHCGLVQQIEMVNYDGFRCKSCGTRNKHPLKKPINGAGYSLDYEFTKTTINLPVELLKELDKKLEEINHWEGQKKLKPAKVKRGQFIRMLLKQHFGFKL